MRFAALIFLCVAWVPVSQARADPDWGRVSVSALTALQERPPSPPRPADPRSPGDSARQSRATQSAQEPDSSSSGGTRVRGRSIVRLVFLAAILLFAAGGFLVKLLTGNSGKS